MMEELKISHRRIAFLRIILIGGIILALASFGRTTFAPASAYAATVLTSGVYAEVATVITVLSTAYNSLENQTDSSPFITAIGERTQPGVVALSRDLLEEIPYGSIVEIVDIGPLEDEPNGCGATIGTVQRMKTFPGLKRGQFRVADTMHIRKTQQMDVWLESYTDAIVWGRCEIALVPVTLATKGGS